MPILTNSAEAVAKRKRPFPHYLNGASPSTELQSMHGLDLGRSFVFQIALVGTKKSRRMLFT